ncbi:MAG: AsmA family protein, partial [Xanthomonadales bacterium]|nr:AsmA family protein [Xanthomonadales bacterium]
MKRLLILGLSVLLTVMLGIAVVLTWLLNDEAWLRERAESFVTELTGRTFRIGAALEIDFAKITVVEARGLSLGDAQWSDVDEMARLDRLRVEVDLPALFSDRPLIRHALIEGGSLKLRANDQAQDNWSDLFVRNGADEGRPREAFAGDLSAWLGEFEIRRFTFSREGPARVPLNTLAVDTLEAVVVDSGQMEVLASGSLNGQPLFL